MTWNMPPDQSPARPVSTLIESWVFCMKALPVLRPPDATLGRHSRSKDQRKIHDELDLCEARPITAQLRAAAEISPSVPGSPNTGPLLKYGRRKGANLARETFSVELGPKSQLESRGKTYFFLRSGRWDRISGLVRGLLRRTSPSVTFSGVAAAAPMGTGRSPAAKRTRP